MRNINVVSRKGFKLKIDLVLLRSNLRKEVVLKMEILLVLLVERNIEGSFEPVLVVAFVVGRIIIR